MLICVVGDCTLDVTVAPAGPISAGRDVRAQIDLAPGGQGANVAVRLARRGARVRLVAPIADDTAGRILAVHLTAESVEVSRLPAPHTAMVVAMLGPGGERSMLSERVALDGDLADALRGADWVHCSGYALRDRLEADRVVAELRASGIRRVSVGGGSFEDWTDAAAAREAIGVLGACLVIVNRDEASLLSGESVLTAAQAARHLASDHRLAIVTDARRGSAAAGLTLGETVVTAAALLTTTRDTTGAGDAYTAVLLARLAPAWPPSADLIRHVLDEASVAGAGVAAVLGAQGRVPGEAEPLDPRTAPR